MLNEMKSELVEIYEARSILKSLVIKNLVGRYKNSVLGFAWHFVNPIILLCVYYLVFTQIRATPIPDFWIYLACGLFPFHFMLNNLTSGSSCIVNNAGMVKKMYFPREIIVLSQVISTFIIMLIGYIIVIIGVAVSGYGMNISVLFLLVLFILNFVFTLGYTLVFSAATVYIRDIQYFLSSISMAFFFLTPMYFMLDSIEGLFRVIALINPFTYFVESYHQVVYYQCMPDTITTIIVLFLSVISLIVGMLVFRKLRTGFAERL